MTKPGKVMSTEMFRVLLVYLESPLGCHVRTNPETKEIEWDCDDELTITERWLREHQLSVKANKRVLREYGGYCDCEVLFNAVNRWPGLDDVLDEVYAFAFGDSESPKQKHRKKKH